jgi:hypothetical protein
MISRRSFFIAAVLVTAAGCSSLNKDVIGQWKGRLRGADVILTLNPDSSYTAKSIGDTAHGRWSSSGNNIQLFHDVRESQGNSFDEAQAATLTYYPDTHTLMFPTPEKPAEFTRVKS